MLLPLLLALAGPSDAASELIVKAKVPVLVYVDGRQAGLNGKLRMRATGLPAGKVDVRVASMFGKTLYEGKWELDDWTVHEAEWRGKALTLVSTTRMAGAPPPVTDEPEAVAAAPDPEPEPEPIALAPEPEREPEPVAPPPPAVVAAPTPAPAASPPPATPALALGVPAGSGAAPAMQPPPAAPPPAAPTFAAVSPPVASPPMNAPLVATPVTMAPAAPPRAITAAPRVAPVGAAPMGTGDAAPRPILIQAREGMRVEVVHDGTSVVVQMNEGVLSVVDPAGMTIAFGAATPVVPAGPPPAHVEIVSHDGHPATVIVDDMIVATIDPGEFRESVQLPAGNYLFELRDPETGRRMHRGIVTVESGDEIEIGYGATQAPRVAERPDAWKAL